MCLSVRVELVGNLWKKWGYVVYDISSLGAPIWVIPVGKKKPLALYLQMSNKEIGIQEVFYVECVVCVTLIMSVKC